MTSVLLFFLVEGPQELVSPCLAPDYSGQWEHAEVIYKLKGQKAGMNNSIYSFIAVICSFHNSFRYICWKYRRAHL